MRWWNLHKDVGSHRSIGYDEKYYHSCYSYYISLHNVSAAKYKMHFTKYVFIHELAFKYVVAKVEDDILSANCSVTMLACLRL